MKFYQMLNIDFPGTDSKEYFCLRNKPMTATAERKYLGYLVLADLQPWNLRRCYPSIAQASTSWIGFFRNDVIRVIIY